MKRLRFYLETTIWNFPFAEETPDFQKITLQFFDKVRMGLFEVYLSDEVLREVRDAPPKRLEQIMGLLREIEPNRLETTAEIERLADVYLAKGALPKKSIADTRHIAHATVHQMDYLLTWNMKHIANFNRKAKIAALNLDEGYRYPMVIANHTEVAYAE